MSWEGHLVNILFYSLQVAALVLAAAAAVRLLGIRHARYLRVFWQLVLAACLLLPLIQPWEATAPQRGSVVSSVMSLRASQASGAESAAAWRPDWAGVLLFLLAAGAVLRLGWLLAGLWGLRRLRGEAKPWTRLPGHLRPLLLADGGRPTVWLSPRMSIPATYGLMRAKILLPADFPELPESHQRSLLCHELLHARRGDWLYSLAEELACCLLWFHPAIWWLRSKIQAAREQEVDRQSIELLNDPKGYVEALLQAARQAGRRTSPALAFFGRSFLSLRIASIARRDTMTPRQLLRFTLILSASLLAASALAAWALPLSQPLETAPEPPGEQPPAATAPQRAHSTTHGEPLRVGSGTLAKLLVHKVEPEYPELARKSGVQGIVFLTVTVDELGAVSDIEVKRGHPLLNQAALDAVRQWRFDPVTKDGDPVAVQGTIIVSFRLPGGSGSKALFFPSEGHRSLSTVFLAETREALNERVGIENSTLSVFRIQVDNSGEIFLIEHESGPNEPEFDDLVKAHVQRRLRHLEEQDDDSLPTRGAELWAALAVR